MLADQLLDVAALQTSPMLPAVSADLLHQLGRHHDAATEFRRAADRTTNTPERDTIASRAADCDNHT